MYKNIIRGLFAEKEKKQTLSSAYRCIELAGFFNELCCEQSRPDKYRQQARDEGFRYEAFCGYEGRKAYTGKETVYAES